MNIISEKRNKIYLHNPEIRNNYDNIDVNDNDFVTDFLKDDKLKYKEHVITILGYTNTAKKHTNWYQIGRAHV